jgi:hypothetical protein
MRQMNASPYCLVPVGENPAPVSALTPVNDELERTQPARSEPPQCERSTSTATSGVVHPAAWAGLGTDQPYPAATVSRPRPTSAARPRRHSRVTGVVHSVDARARGR